LQNIPKPITRIIARGGLDSGDAISSFKGSLNDSLRDRHGLGAVSDLKIPPHPEKIPPLLGIAITTKAGMPPLPSTLHRNPRVLAQSEGTIFLAGRLSSMDHPTSLTTTVTIQTGPSHD